LYGRGDRGETDLFGGGRVPKNHPRVECYGELDELSSIIGLCRSLLKKRHRDLDEILRGVQEALFRIGAELASADRSRLTIELASENDVEALDKLIEEFEARLPPLKHFIYPGGSLTGSMLHVARAVCRRAERSAVALSLTEQVNPYILSYLNRLSTLLFILARHVNLSEGVGEEIWRGRGLG